jgi:adenylate kinase family enzyme
VRPRSDTDLTHRQPQWLGVFRPTSTPLVSSADERVSGNENLRCPRYVSKVLLLTGLPASGKSTFGRYLCDRHGMYLLILEEEPPVGDTRGQELRRIWRRHVGQGAAERFVRALRNDPQTVVVEWGFPVNEPCLAFVRSMKENGVRVVWFECPDDVARARYADRGTPPVEYFDVQTPAIRANYKRIMEEITPEIVAVLKSDGSPFTPEELYAVMFND